MFDSIVNAISDFSDWLWNIIESLFIYVENLIDSILDTLLNFPAYIYERLGDGIVEFFEWIPVPGFFNSAKNAFSSIPPDIIFYGNAFQIAPGIAMIITAYLLRFAIRRIPFIG